MGNVGNERIASIVVAIASINNKDKLLTRLFRYNGYIVTSTLLVFIHLNPLIFGFLPCVPYYR